MNRKIKNNEVITYQRNVIKINGKLKPLSVEIAKANPEMCGEWFEGCEVHHINWIENDDRPENLVCLNSKTHHYIHSKAVDVFYKGNFLGRFPNYTMAAKEFNFNTSVISYYVKYQKPISKTYRFWRFAKVPA